MDHRATRGWGAIACLGAALVSGCSSDPRSELLERVYEALSAGDEAGFLRWTITTADFDLKAQGVSPFQAGQTYLGGVIRPEQIAEQRRQFQRAIAAGPGCIDFTRDELAGCGSVLGEGSQETLGGNQVHYLVCSLRIERDGKELDAKELYPRFVLTEWVNGYRLLALVLPNE
jgi:hypothetical protein